MGSSAWLDHAAIGIILLTTMTSATGGVVLLPKMIMMMVVMLMKALTPLLCAVETVHEDYEESSPAYLGPRLFDHHLADY